MTRIFLVCMLSFFLCNQNISSQDNTPNILLIIADDMGIDITNGYQQNIKMPSTPILDSLRATGITYMNTWSSPTCAPTRASIMSGKFGIKTGVMKTPGNLDLIDTSVFNMIHVMTDSSYANAVIGKWHISNPVDYDHPMQHGVDHYEGLFTAMVDNYYSWNKVKNGTLSTVNEYVTSHLTDSAIDWIDNQTEPWLLWMAHVAPHSPFHVPPTELYTTSDTTGQRNKFIVAIEAMDTEIGRLINSLDTETKENTVVIFIGDNGTPGPVVQFFDSDHAKSSLYEGGIRVPMIISGKGVSRINEEETGLTQVSDLYATILDLAGIQLSGGIHNSLSLKPSFSCTDQIERPYLYIDFNKSDTLSWAIRNDQYKLIEDEYGHQEFYDITADLAEQTNLIGNLTTLQQSILTDMEAEALTIRSDWSCQDGIKNGNETTLDDCDDSCTDDNSTSTTNIGCCAVPVDPSVFYEFIESNKRHIYTNDFPNHDYCYNPNFIPSQTYYDFSLDVNPSFANDTSLLVRPNGRPLRYFGVAKNGVIIAPAPAAPFIFENPNTGQFNWDWVYEATNNQGNGMELVALDCASAHTGPQGYHYHGEMYQYLETIYPGVTASQTPPSEPIHIGWAADGFPILYKFGPDSEGKIKKLRPSFQLKSGLRPGDGTQEPCGPYNGKYTRDYEYICGKGDLDPCNGFHGDVTLQTANGMQTFNYFYVISSTFPQIPRCLLGTPTTDMLNSSPQLTGTDADNDGFLSDYDCDDDDASINPNAEEIIGNSIDENCDGLSPLCTKTVSTLMDSGIGSFRDAIACAVSGDTILIDPAVAGDTLLLTSTILIDKTIHILPPVGNTIFLSISGSGPIFMVQVSGELEIDNLNLISGTSNTGSALVNNGTVRLNNVLILTHTSNVTTTSLIENNGVLTIEGTTNLKKQ